MKKTFFYTFIAITFLTLHHAQAERFKIDTKDTHAFIQFKIKHLGYSWLYGRFNTFNGWFNIDYDNLNNSIVEVVIDTASIDTNYAKRDQHLRGNNFLAVKHYPQASFISTALKVNQDNSGILTGNLTLHGVTKSIDIAVKLVGEGKDPWGGYRTGFEGFTTLTLKDFGITYNLGPASAKMDMMLSIEGIRQ